MTSNVNSSKKTHHKTYCYVLTCLYKTVPYKTVQNKTVRKSMKMIEKTVRYKAVRKTVLINNCFNKPADREFSFAQQT